MNQTTERQFVSPLAKRLAKERGVDIAGRKGSGPRGRIVKADIEQWGDGGPSSSVMTAIMPMILDKNFEPPYKMIPLTAMRRVIAERLLLSKTTIPHFYLTIDCNMTRVMELRQKWQGLDDGKTKDEKGSPKISVNDVVIKALAMACHRVPSANAGFTNDGIKQFLSVDVAVAVAVDGGLITPIIRGADKKSLQIISTEMKELAGRARAGKLQPQEYQGGTISLSNLGMFGIKQFDAVINPPQGAILAVGAVIDAAVVKDGRVVVAPMMTATLSCDHRVVDGAIGAELLKYFRLYIEDPALMFFSA